MTLPTIQEIWADLDEVKDPEIPVVSIIEMGIVRDVTLDGDRVTVTLTPTFSGCPALHVMQVDVEHRLRDLGFANIAVNVTLSPPWSTELISEGARAKLKAFGLAPPPHHDGDISLVLREPVACPYCGSESTSLRNAFGPTLCRAIFTCNTCKQPFEQFKPL